MGAVASAPSAIQCLTAWGHWAVQLLQYTASALRGSKTLNFCNAVPHRPGQLALQLVQYADSLPGDGWQCDSCNALPHSLGAVGSAFPAMQCITSWGQ